MKIKSSGVDLPPEFSGPAQLILFTRYGDPRDIGYKHKWINHWEVKKDFPWFPLDELFVHKHFHPLLINAFSDLTLNGRFEEVKSAEDCFDIRLIRGSNSVLSVHSWGAAIDMNIIENPLGSAGSWSNEFVATMIKNEIFCGQTWEGRKDPMHFAMVNG